MNDTRILIVEDSRTQADALRALIEEHVAVVDVASSAEEALERLECAGSELPDVIVSDVVMPGMSGYDLTRRIKANPALSQVPVILLTSLTDPLDIVRGLECGADNYVTKPYDAGLLLARLRHAIGQKRLRRDSRASMGVTVSFLGTQFTINSEREQILDLFISSVEDVVRTNHALQVSQQELAEAQEQLERYARQMAVRAHVSAEKYSALMQQASDAILVLGDGNTIIEANARAIELLGRPLAEMRSRQLTEYVAPEDAGDLDARLSEPTSRAGAAQGDIVFRHARGAEICCEVSVSRTSVDGGDLHLVILHDVTARRLEESAVRRTNALLGAVIQASPMAIGAIDGQGRITVWNPAAERIFGWTREELIGRPIPNIPPDRVTEHREIRQGVKTGVDTQRLRRDGTLIDVRVSSAALRDEEGDQDGAVVIIEDIRERKRADAALAESEQQLRQAQKMDAIGRLAGGVAHDFNNLLTAIRGYTHLLLAEVPGESPMREDLEEIDKASIRAGALTAQLLAFSRKQVNQPQVLNVNDIVEGMQRLLSRLLSENIAIDASLDRAIGCVRIDSGQLEQVVMNLAVNAGDAMPGGGRLSISTRNVDLTAPLSHPHGTVPPGAYVELTMRDTGTGMSPEVVSHVFEPFFTTKDPGKGTGLGLSTVYGIVNQAGGFIVLDSAPGMGTAFRIVLPRVSLSPDTPRPQEAEATEPRGSETILIAEDDSAVRAVASKTLRHAGYRVLEASDALSALNLFETHAGRIDLLLTDAVMPGMDGSRLIERLLVHRPRLQVLMMTGYTDRELPTRVSGESIRILNKPFSPSQLARAVRDIFAEPR
jgi:two-component system, cell cycle sensor histidine kinase and response regulator CckA